MADNLHKKKRLIAIAITPFTPAPSHAARIVELLTNGYDYVHVRYPEASPDTTASIINAVPTGLRSRITVHDNFEALAAEGIGGIHLNRRNPAAPPGWKGRVSLSAHSLEEVAEAGEGFAYVTLSPVYPSISKSDYVPLCDLLGSLARLPNRQVRVVALGGVTPDRIAEIEMAGFDGYAMLGAIDWT